MTHIKRKLTLLLMCLLLLGGTAMASSEEVTVEAEASEEITEETVEESEASSKEEPVGTSNEARDYINYYLMPEDSPYLEIAEAAEYIYTTVDAANHEQIVFSAMDWLALSEAAQAEVNSVLPEGYLALLQEAVDYAAASSARGTFSVRRSKVKNKHRKAGQSHLIVRFRLYPVWVLVWVSGVSGERNKKQKACNPLGLQAFSWSC